MAEVNHAHLAQLRRHERKHAADKPEPDLSLKAHLKKCPECGKGPFIRLGSHLKTHK